MTQVKGSEGKPLSPERRSQQFEATEYDAHQEKQRWRNWTLNDVPFYKGKGQSLEQNPFDWHHFDYLNYYDQVYGRKCGAGGIGKLREVALVVVSEDDDYTNHPYFKDDPAYMSRLGFQHTKGVDVERLRQQQEAYAEVLKQNGVSVYWVKFPHRAMGAFGPMTNRTAAASLMIIPGGSIIPKKPYSLSPTSGFGQAEYLGRWAFWNLSIPPLLTIMGKGTWGPGVFLADDIYCQAMSIETDDEGMRQVEPVLRRQCGEHLHIQRIYTPDHQYFDPATGIGARADMIIAPLDLRTVLVHSPGVDVDTVKWLWDSGYKVIEANVDERMALPCSSILLEPGHVIMPANAPKTIAAVGRAGIQVTAVEYNDHDAIGMGIRSATMQILRDNGPRRFS